MDIKETLLALINDLNNPLIKSMQHSFNKHISAIEECKEFGVSDIMLAKTLNEELEVKITKAYLNTLISRARKPKGSTNNKNKTDSSAVIKKEIIQTNSIANEVLDEWKQKTLVTSERLVRKLTESGYTIEDVKSWNCPNEMQITNRLTMLGDKK